MFGGVGGFVARRLWRGDCGAATAVRRLWRGDCGAAAIISKSQIVSIAVTIVLDALKLPHADRPARVSAAARGCAQPATAARVSPLIRICSRCSVRHALRRSSSAKNGRAIIMS